MKPSKKLLAALLAAGSLLSVGGIVHIADSEGKVNRAYPDPATGGKPWTICRGHTGPEVHPGLVVSDDQCDKWYAEDLSEAESHVKRLVRVPLSQGEYDAYTSFVFNVGPEKFRTSTMLRKVNLGDWKGGCREFPRWKYANKMVMEGLVVRRYKELTMCLNGGPYVYRP